MGLQQVSLCFVIYDGDRLQVPIPRARKEIEMMK
jgi:hypothetical protein